MTRSTPGDFLRTVRKAIFHYVGLACVFLIAVGALFIGLGDISISDIHEWRPALLLPALAVIVGYFYGWGLAMRLHIDSWLLRLMVFMAGALTGAAFGLAALIAGLYLAGLPAEAEPILRESALMFAVYCLLASGGLLISGVSFVLAKWVSWFWDFE